jgi:hypothetical protein
MGDKMSDAEFRAQMYKATTTPWTRFKDTCILWMAKIGLFVVLVLILTHLDAIVDWWNGK